jgi:hypothetical protein
VVNLLVQMAGLFVLVGDVGLRALNQVMKGSSQTPKHESAGHFALVVEAGPTRKKHWAVRVYSWLTRRSCTLHIVL